MAKKNVIAKSQFCLEVTSTGQIIPFIEHCYIADWRGAFSGCKRLKNGSFQCHGENWKSCFTEPQLYFKVHFKECLPRLCVFLNSRVAQFPTPLPHLLGVLNCGGEALQVILHFGFSSKPLISSWQSKDRRSDTKTMKKEGAKTTAQHLIKIFMSPGVF